MVVAKLPKVWNFQKIELGSFNDFETYLILFNKKKGFVLASIYINLNNIHSDSAFCYKHFSVLTCHCLHAHANVLLLKGPFTNTCKGGLMQKKIDYRENFSGPPFRPQKNFRAPLFAMKITGQPHRKACKLNF